MTTAFANGFNRFGFSVVAGINNFLGTEPLASLVPSEYLPPLALSNSAFFKPVAKVEGSRVDDAEIERMINYYFPSA
ncbi:hypothetical protein [Legionella sp. km772]|uniref:hypothetical protein n=1 Tax=Legionella sp. km772 TaxID=2498111 RepID=UPI000FA394DD|nr:hypothetical protein [Legionella sp. km772]RUR07729.1 hypothetical protein ELY15_11850 [Legionella sp. km772]